MKTLESRNRALLRVLLGVAVFLVLFTISYVAFYK